MPPLRFTESQRVVLKRITLQKLAHILRLLKTKKKKLLDVFEQKAKSLKVVQGCQIFLAKTYQNGGK
jgi:hypothetical protein